MSVPRLAFGAREVRLKLQSGSDALKDWHAVAALSMAWVMLIVYITHPLSKCNIVNFLPM